MDPRGDGTALRVLLTVHHDLVRGAGAAGTTLALADELVRRGHRAEVVGLELLSTRRGPMLDALTFPHAVARLATRRLAAGDLDVLDASSGDLAYVPRARVRVSASAVLTRSHGLEQLAIARRRQGDRAGELTLRWRYSLYHAGLRRMEVARSLRAADGVLVLNDAESRFVEDVLSVPASRVWRTAPVVEPVEPVAPAARGGAVRDVLVLGPASWRKGGDVAVRVLEAVLRADPSVTASWHGLDDPGALALDVAPDVRARLELAGRYGREELAVLLGSHRVLLVASRSEGLPVTVLEALSAGVPVVGTDVPGVADLLGSGAGVLVEDGHVAGLAAALRGMLADEAKRTRCADAARALAASLSPASVVDALEAAYRGVLALKARPS